MQRPEDTRTAAPQPAATPTDDMYCPDCGYSLRGLLSDRCPECGLDLAVVRDPESAIPWVHRRQRGRIRSFWATVLMVMFRQQRFCLEICRPVDESAARRFRWATVIWAYLPFPLLTAAAVVLARRPFSELFEWAGWWLLAAIHLAIIGCLAVVTGVPYYALHHKDVPAVKRHRAAVLMLYAGGPLAWAFVVALCVLAGMMRMTTLMDHWGPPMTAIGYFLAAAGLLLGLLYAVCAVLYRIINRMLRNSGAVLMVTMNLAALWLLAAVLTLVGIPAGAFFLAVVWYSLR